MSTSTKRVLNSFVNWCHKYYSDEIYLTQEMVDAWSVQHANEKNTTLASRVSAINAFLRHINDRGGTFKYAEHGRVEVSTPKIITEPEFRNVLRAADEMVTVPKSHKYYLRYMTAALVMPVLIRLMYSSGIRPPEARLLQRDNVDFESALLYVRQGKGYNEHIVALDYGVCDLLRVYDAKMNKLFPNRVAFFCREDGDFITADSLNHTWRRLFTKYNGDTRQDDEKIGVTLYSLRHNYATFNLDRLPENDKDKEVRMVAISKSMGHKSVENTIKYYYHLTAESDRLLDTLMGDTFDSILPDID